MNTRALAATAAFFVWVSAVAMSYYVYPAEPGPPPHDFLGLAHARDALWSAAGAIGGAALVLLAARGLAFPAAPFLSTLTPGPLLRLLMLHAVGFQLLTCVSLVLAALGAYTPAVVAATTGSAAIPGLVGWRRDLPSLWSHRQGYAPRTTAEHITVAIVCAALMVVAVGALAPETEFDALWYHLWLPQQWLAAGTAVDIVEEYVSLYPLSWEMAYGAALAVSGPDAAKLLHVVPYLGVAGSAAVLTRIVAPSASRWMTIALVITTPLLMWEATTAYVDLALAWYVALAAAALLLAHRTGDVRWLWWSAVLLGGALAIKHLGLVVLAIYAPLALALTWHAGLGLPAAVRRAIIYAFVALAFGMPWYARAYVASGNPVFPEMYTLFGAEPVERWSPESEQSLRRFKQRFGAERSATTLVTLPWNVTMHGARYGGTLGPLFLILVPAGLIAGRRNRLLLITMAGGAAYVGVWASPISSFQLRFLVPLVPFLAMMGAAGALAVAAVAARTARAAPVVVTGAIAMLLLFNFPPFIRWHERDRVGWDGWLTHVMREIPIPVVVGDEPRARYLARHVPSYNAWAFIDAEAPPDARVLTFSGGDHLYSRRARLWSDAWAAHAAVWGAPLGGETAALDALRQLGVTHVLFDMRQLSAGALDELAIGGAALRRCCLSEQYNDGRFAVYAVQPPRRWASVRDGPAQ